MLLAKKSETKYGKMFSEFGQAFKAEIKALEKNPPSVKLVKLRLVNKSIEGFIYEGVLSETRSIISNTPCALTSDHKIDSYDVEVLDAEKDMVLLRSDVEIEPADDIMTLHIGEKIIVRELARSLVERKSNNCDLGEKLFSKECDVSDDENSGDVESIAGVVLNRDVSYINVSEEAKNRKDDIELISAILYNNVVELNKSVLYLADKNRRVDQVMGRLNTLLSECDKNVNATRLGCPVSSEFPEEMLAGSDDKIISPERLELKKILEDSLYKEDVNKLVELKKKLAVAESEIESSKKIISEMEDVIVKTEKQISDYHGENAVKKKILISGDYETDHSIRINKAKNKIKYNKELINENEKAVKELRESIKFYDKEQEYLDVVDALGKEQRRQMLKSQVLGTTMSMSFLDDEVLKRKADVLIIDGYSRIWIPAIWNACYAAGKQVVLVGNKTEKPEVLSGKGKIAERWLMNNIYDMAEISKPFEL